MKYLKVILGFPIVLFPLFLAVSLFMEFSDPIPAYDNLHHIKGKLADFYQWKTKYGKGPRCGIRLTISVQDSQDEVIRVNCHKATEKLEHRIGASIDIYMKLNAWYQLLEKGYDIYELKVGNDYIYKYQDKSQFYMKGKDLDLLFAGLLFCVAVYALYQWIVELLKLISPVSARRFRDSYDVYENAGGVLVVKKVIGPKFIANVSFISSVGVSLFLLSIYFFFFLYVIGFLFFAGSTVFIVCALFVINPKMCSFQKQTKLIAWKDYFCREKVFEDLGAIAQLTVYQLTFKGKKSFHLVADCENGAFTMFDGEDLIPLEKLKFNLCDYLGLETNDVVVETEQPSDVNKNGGRRIEFMFGVPGFIFYSVFAMSILYALTLANY